MLFFLCGHFCWIFLAFVLTFNGRLSFLGAKIDFWKWMSFFDYRLTDIYIYIYKRLKYSVVGRYFKIGIALVSAIFLNRK